MKKVNVIRAKEKAEKKTKVAAYCRVSTGSDDQLISLDAQKKHYESYIRSNEAWELVDIYFDEGITGTKKDIRPGLMKMLDDCENGLIDLVITKSISRFSRNLIDFLEMVRKLKELNVTIIFEKEGLNTSSLTSEFMMTTMAKLAENESVSTSQNLKWSARKRFEAGAYKMAYAPYGYKTVDGSLIVVPEEAEVVKEIFNRCLAGEGTEKIAKALNDIGIVTKRGNRWSGHTVGEILKNEKYIGDSIFQKTYMDNSFKRHINHGELDMYLVEDTHEPIVSREVFNQAAEIVRMRGAEKGNRGDGDKYQKRYAFSGKIICGECKSVFKRRIHQRGTSYIAWACIGHQKDKNSCSMLYLEDEAIKGAYITMMNKVIYGHGLILKPLMRNLRAMNSEDRLLRISEIDGELEQIREQEDTLIKLASEGLLDSSKYTASSTTLQIRAKDLHEDRTRLLNTEKDNRLATEALSRLMEFAAKGKMMTEFDDELFLDTVENITVEKRDTLVFNMKCGLRIKERTHKEVYDTFRMKDSKREYADPYRNAEHKYGLIEREVKHE